MRLLCLLLLLSLFVSCKKDEPQSVEPATAQSDSLKMVTDSLDSLNPQRRVGFTGKHMHGTSYGTKDPAKEAHQDVKKIYRMRKNLGEARARGREAHRKAEEARRQLMNRQKQANEGDTVTIVDTAKK